MAELPEVTPDFIAQSVSDYETTFAKGTEAELSAAKLRLVWALSHAKDPKHNKRGIELADELLRVPQAVPDDCTHREVEYMKAVALFRMGSYIKCRQQCNAILQEHPESRQVITLKDAADEAIVRDGLIGVGIGLTGVVGVVAALALSAAASRR